MSGAKPLRKGRICSIDDSVLAEAVGLLRAGEIVALPTETVYGLAADASSANAVAAIYRAKGRPDFNPLIVHVLDVAAAKKLADFDNRAEQLAAAFWPGPLTLVLPLRADAPVAAAVTAGLSTIAIRCPAHRVMRAVLTQSGLALAAPSANRSGAISPTQARHVCDSLGDGVPLILDGGPCSDGLESTIIILRANGWQTLRPGPVTGQAIEAVLGNPELKEPTHAIEAPGQLASHYAPTKALRLNACQAEADEWHIGFGMLMGDDNLSASGDLVAAASRLFDALHRADKSERQRIAVAPIPDIDIGEAINDRLRRAAA